MAIFLGLLFFFLGELKAVDGNSYDAGFTSSNESVSSQPLIEKTLSNGLRLILKPTQYSEGEVLFLAAAKEGYAQFEPAERATIQLAPQVGWVSGWGGRSSQAIEDQLNEALIEMTATVLPFSRTIQGSYPSHNQELFLKTLVQVFSEPEFTREAAKSVINQIRRARESFVTDWSEVLEECAKEANFTQLPQMKTLVIEDLAKFNFEKSHDYYFNRFLNLKDYQLIFVGDFDPEQLVKQFESALSGSKKRSIESALDVKGYTVPEQLIKGRANKKVCLLPSSRDGAGITRLTFPIEITINEQNIQWLELISQVVETRLRNHLKGIFGSTMGVDIAYEFPLSPNLDKVWILIQFSHGSEKPGVVAQYVLKELVHMKHAGATLPEVNAALRQVHSNDEIWRTENSYWQASIGNFVLWGFDPHHIDPVEFTSSQKLKGEIDAYLKQYIQTDHYTEVILLRPDQQ